MNKKRLGISVLEAARQRIEVVFNRFERICVAFSGGKDSTVLLHLTMEEAIKRNRTVGVLFVDLEGQYELTIDHIAKCLDEYRNHVDPYWVALPLHLRNAVSMYQNHWICWDSDCRDAWIRSPHKTAIMDESFFPFFKKGMEFEDFIPAFVDWYADGKTCASLVGIRSDESLNRFRTIASKTKSRLDNYQWTTRVSETSFYVYPIYDWKTEDIWRYSGKFCKTYNRIYDLMHRAGVSIHQSRICQPYGDDQKRGLWLFHLLEPNTWSKIVTRVSGANSGAMYAKEKGNVSGYRFISKPHEHTWKSFATMLLESLPIKTRRHFENKIAVFIHWWESRGYPDGIPDEADSKLEANKKAPSWRRICKVLLRNDFWCRGLSFSQQKSHAYEKYLKLMENKKREWNRLW